MNHYDDKRGPSGLAKPPDKCSPAALERLIVFTRFPEPGRVKTRLIPHLGAERAAELQRQMTLNVLEQAAMLGRRRRLDVEVSFDGGTIEDMRRTFGRTWRYRKQVGRDLGTRMHHALASARREGMGRTVLVGTDCPGVSVELLEKAFRILESREFVFGPAEDGGYYLVGGRDVPADLFDGVRWGSDTVLEETLDRLARRAATVGFVDRLRDVDDPDDLRIWRNRLGDSRNQGLKRCISVIIPTLNESGNMECALRGVSGLRDVEVIVVDGGSNDSTLDIAARCGAEVLSCDAGRAVQMNAGAGAARGDILLFLHADVVLPEGFAVAVRNALAEPDTVAGAFRFALNARGFRFRMIENLVGFRCRLFRMPYGDQALFMPRRVFEAIGGFPEVPIMEDYLLVRRLTARGRVAMLKQRALISARRWQHLGVFRATLRNQVAVLSCLLGVRMERIAQRYHHEP